MFEFLTVADETAHQVDVLSSFGTDQSVEVSLHLSHDMTDILHCLNPNVFKAQAEGFQGCVRSLDNGIVACG